MTFRTMPEAKVLRELLRYESESGRLYWLHRSPEWFPTGRHHGQVGLAAQWNAKYAEAEAFTATNRSGYRIGAVLGKGFLAHRVIWKMYYGFEPSNQIDHSDGNRINNRIVNLREATPSENAQNRKRSASNTSGKTGVWLDKRYGTWVAHIKILGQSTYLGSFRSKDEAATAYAAAKVNQHPFQPIAREGGE